MRPPGAGGRTGGRIWELGGRGGVAFPSMQNPNATPRTGGSQGGSHLRVGGSRGVATDTYEMAVRTSLPWPDPCAAESAWIKASLKASNYCSLGYINVFQRLGKRLNNVVAVDLG